MGFEATLPVEYLAAPDPRLRFITRSGVVLVTLDTVVETPIVERYSDNRIAASMAER